MEKIWPGNQMKIRKEKDLIKASQNAYFRSMSCQTSMISQLFIVKQSAWQGFFFPFHFFKCPSASELHNISCQEHWGLTLYCMTQHFFKKSLYTK